MPTPHGLSSLEPLLDQHSAGADAMYAMLREAVVTLRAAQGQVVGQPGLIYERGDRDLADHLSEQHGWLYRVQSLLAADVPYAASSDAPVTEPAPGLALYAPPSR